MEIFYKCLRSSELGAQLQQFFDNALHAAHCADDYAKSMGAVSYIQPAQYFEGGVDFLEFDGEPDGRVWKKRTDLGEPAVYEPNCKANQGVLVLDDKNTMPSNTWRRVYQREHLSWTEVRHRFPQAYWMSLAGMKPSGDKKQDDDALNGYFSKKYFVVFLDFTVDGMRNILKKKERYVRQAVMAERLRMSLPVVKVQSLYDILLPVDDKHTDATPTLFIYKDTFFIGVPQLCQAEGLMEISAEEHEKTKNAALTMSGENDAS